jgi:serine/threonine-protein kinase
MEFVEGRSLAQVLAADGPLEPARAAAIAEGIAEALSFAHANGLVHRDVKPANVMITPAGQVKVMDFGIARLATSHTITQTSTVFGTAAYLAPEQAQGLRVDGRADVYALGVVLYEMLAGRVPFRADSALAVASKHVLEQPEPPSAVRPGVPAGLEAVALRALAKDPGDRYQSAAEMAAALRNDTGAGAVVTGPPTEPIAEAQAPAPATAVLADRTAVLPPVRRGTHAAPGRRGRRVAPVLVLAVLAVVGAVLAAALLGGNPAPRPLGIHSKRAGHHASPAAPSGAPATSAPVTSAPPATSGPGTSTFVGAANTVASAIDAALASGSIDDHTAADLGHSLDEATKRYAQDGDLEHALAEIASAKDHLARDVEHGSATPQAAAVIGAAFDQLATAMQSAPPTSGPPAPPGHHDHGHGHGNDNGQGGDGGD